MPWRFIILLLYGFLKLKKKNDSLFILLQFICFLGPSNFVQSKCSDLFSHKRLIFVAIHEHDILEDKKHFILNIGFWKGMFNSFYFMSCYENQETQNWLEASA